MLRPYGRLLCDLKDFQSPLIADDLRIITQEQGFSSVDKKKSQEVGVLISEEYFYKVFNKQMYDSPLYAGFYLKSDKQELHTGLQKQRTGAAASGINECFLHTYINLLF